MGILSGIKKAVQAGRERRKANRADRQANRRQRRQDRRAFKLAKIQARQDGRSERTRMRQEAKVSKQELISHADEVAYENGMEPVQHQGALGAALNTVGDVVGGIFSKDDGSADSDGDYDVDDGSSSGGSGAGFLSALQSKGGGNTLMGSPILLIILGLLGFGFVMSQRKQSQNKQYGNRT